MIKNVNNNCPFPIVISIKLSFYNGLINNIILIIYANK